MGSGFQVQALMPVLLFEASIQSLLGLRFRILALQDGLQLHVRVHVQLRTARSRGLSIGF